MQKLSSHFPLFFYNKTPSLLDICSPGLLSSHPLLSFTPLSFHLHDVTRILLSKWLQPPLFQIQGSTLSPPVMTSQRWVSMWISTSSCTHCLHLVWWRPLSSFLPTLQAVLFQSLGWFFLISLSSKWSCVPGPLLISSGLMALVTIHILILSVGRFISVGLTSFLNSRLLYPAAYSTSPVGWLRSISDLIQPKSNSWKC